MKELRWFALFLIGSGTAFGAIDLPGDWQKLSGGYDGRSGSRTAAVRRGRAIVEPFEAPVEMAGVCKPPFGGNRFDGGIGVS